jgi:preprotein translocase subunit SecG
VPVLIRVVSQQGGQDLASAFGGAGSQTAFGARGTATLLSKITAGAAAIFMITSLTLSFLRPAVSTRTVVPDLPAPATETTTPSEETTTPVPPPSEEQPSETPPPAEETETETQPEATSTAPPPN